ncbi:hypothetical protein LCGC14_2121020 [marine sediment metagenome]|uniref:Holin n=1 Tax=marine sediment metagenome TaxID=412755 RepID=A0A0F9GHD7_9ZZZZ
MKNLLQRLKGKKTYILAVLVGIVTTAHALGWIETHAYITLLGLLGAGSAATLRDGINNSK